VKRKDERQKYLETLQRAVVYEEADSRGFCTCISCGKRGFISDMDGGHGFSKGANSRLALFRENIHAQCQYCNRILNGNRKMWFEGLKDRYGMEAYEHLMLLDRACCGNGEALAELSPEERDKVTRNWTEKDYREERRKWQKVIRENAWKKDDIM